ncbi:hypothetical protein LCGC14_2672930 [marine sediment metagenome]|uniref:Uncharacterized protein n=1 Tax=marine sediment metagenome TaxID=412755 RepID=A0A0F8ZNK9_9ZZZZ
MKMYVFTYLDADSEIKNTGLVRADDLIKAAVTIRLQAPSIQVIGMSLVSASRELDFFSEAVTNGSLRLNQKNLGKFEW